MAARGGFDFVDSGCVLVWVQPAAVDASAVGQHKHIGLRRLRGEASELDAPFGARFRSPFRYKPGRVFLLRTRVEPDDEAPEGGFFVRPPGEQDSSFLASLARANAIVILPADRSEVISGSIGAQNTSTRPFQLCFLKRSHF